MAHMIDVTEATDGNEALVLRLIRAMETGDLPETLKAVCTNDFVWANSGLATINGQDELFEQMARGGFANEIPILKTMTHFSAELIHMASSGDIVFTERVDNHWDEQGRDLMTPHICGVAEIRDSKISAFRDFYDVVCYSQTPTEVQEGFDLASFRDAQSNGTK
jgi:limonene-1,2-epoxide hydrolase